MNYQTLFLEMAADLGRMEDRGTVADQIPELPNVDPDKFGIHLAAIDNRH